MSRPRLHDMCPRRRGTVPYTSLVRPGTEYVKRIRDTARTRSTKGNEKSVPDGRFRRDPLRLLSGGRREPERHPAARSSTYVYITSIGVRRTQPPLGKAQRVRMRRRRRRFPLLCQLKLCESELRLGEVEVGAHAKAIEDGRKSGEKGSTLSRGQCRSLSAQ